MYIYNIKQKDIIYDVTDYKKNHRYEQVRAELSSIDPIGDYEDFQFRVQEFKKKGKPFSNHKYSVESYFYGYYQALTEFAEMKASSLRVPLFSHIEHGAANIDSHRDPFDRNSISYCSTSNYRREDIHTIAPNRMYISVGPYIHYATKIYDEEEEKRIKEHLGKTLLVFPFHTCENEETGEEEQNILFDTVYSKYSSLFDTVMVCAYWFDAGNPIFERYKERGAKIVSAGFRGDKNFIRRLKTIISLSDACVMDEVGTNLGFCYYMKKPTYLEKRKTRFEDRLMEENTSRFVDAFFSDNFIFSNKQKKLQQELYNYYWGADCIKSKDELRGIFININEVLKISRYNIRADKVDKAIDVYKAQLKRSRLKEDEFLLDLLEQALN